MQKKVRLKMAFIDRSKDFDVHPNGCASLELTFCDNLTTVEPGNEFFVALCPSDIGFSIGEKRLSKEQSETI
jgi:hypothetical protein